MLAQPGPRQLVARRPIQKEGEAVGDSGPVQDYGLFQPVQSLILDISAESQSSPWFRCWRVVILDPCSWPEAWGGTMGDPRTASSWNR